MARLLPLALLLAACPDPADDAVDTDADDVVCAAEAPAELTLRPGLQDDGVTFLSLDGRSATPPGPNLVVPGYPARVVVHPTLPVAYVATASSDDRGLLVVDLDGLTVLQELERDDALNGLVVSPDGERVYAAGGAGGDVDVYAVGEDGTLAASDSWDVGGYASGLALSPDGATLWVGLLLDDQVVEIETAPGKERRRLGLPIGGWDVLHVPAHGELYVADLSSAGVVVVDLDGWSVTDTVDAPLSTTGLAARPDGSRVWAVSPGTDEVLAIDPVSHDVLARAPVADDLLGPDGEVLRNSNANGVAYDAATDRLYVTRGADNAVSVIDGDTLTVDGAIPAPWYPTWPALTPDGASLVVVAGKGGGAGPSNGGSAKTRLAGSVTVVGLDDLDLAATTAEVSRQYARPVELFDFDCAGRFPVPTPSGTGTPIEHVVLVVKENKTYDCVFGDFEGADGDRSLTRWGEDVNPNLYALARRFVLADNFYDQVQESDNGHLFLTQAHLTEWDERAFLEQGVSGRFSTFQIAPAAVPSPGNFFTRLMDQGIDLQIYGEIVGTFAKAADGTTPAAFSDPAYPGGPFFNMGVKDVEKARYIIERMNEGRMPPFTFLLFTNDHTAGTTPGQPTPESMIADNDEATGLLVDAISHSPYWEKTVVFIVEDDPQGCEDHVDAHRSYALVVSPWTKRGYVSHVQASFLSVFATMERILGVPPMGRPDATAAPMWDVFTQTPDTTPFDAIPRVVPEEVNQADAVGARASLQMDFSGPDRNPALHDVLRAHHLVRTGRLAPADAERLVASPEHDPEAWEELVEEAEEDGRAYDVALAAYLRWAKEHGVQVPAPPPRKVALRDDD